MSLRSVRLVPIATAGLLLTPSAASAAWTVPPTPNVEGASSTNLLAVDCSSANSCMAVGHATNVTAGTSATVAERWDGTSWQIVPTPNPPGVTHSSLNGVSCPWPNVCFAVGSPGPLVELWNGTSWSIQPSPDVPFGSLDAVSCSGLLACTAVGSSYQEGYHPLAERWDATGWHVQSTPDPTDSQYDQLFAVSCPQRRTCTAVGASTIFDASGGHTSPLVERWFGRVNAWGLQSAPKPAGAERASLAGVSCPGGSVCFAVGYSSHPDVSATGTATLAERRIGSTWSVMPTPNPQGSSFAGLLGVSCPARLSCHAVGSTDTPGPIPIAERFDGASWQLEFPAPSILNPFLAGVSCPDRTFCMAVGGYTHLSSGGTLSAKWTP
jgi:hypothetical protein